MARYQNKAKDGFITLVLLEGRLAQSPLVYDFNSTSYPLGDNESDCSYVSWYESPELTHFVEKREKNFKTFIGNLVLIRPAQKVQIFIVYKLFPVDIQWLHDTKLGVNADNFEKDLKLIQQLPKAELHCHLGGVNTSADLVKIGLEVCKQYSIKTLSETELKKLTHLVEICELEGPSSVNKHLGMNTNLKALKEFFAKFGKPSIAAAYFLSSFENKVWEILKEFIYGDCIEDCSFRAIDIHKYESLGDLQGSTLLQNEVAIRASITVYVL